MINSKWKIANIRFLFLHVLLRVCMISYVAIHNNNIYLRDGKEKRKNKKRGGKYELED